MELGALEGAKGAGSTKREQGREQREGAGLDMASLFLQR